MPTLDNALVRILYADGSTGHPVGGGFLASSRHVITCAHVVATALGVAHDMPEAPQQAVFLDFPLLAKHSPLRAKVVQWYPVKQDTSVDEYGDIAVLELFTEISLPDDAIPAPIAMLERDKLHDRQVRMCGFPQGMEMGDWLNGTLQGVTGTGLVQLDNQIGRRCIAPGFSGTPVWDKEENSVAGIVVSTNTRDQDRISYMIPGNILCKSDLIVTENCQSTRDYKRIELWFNSIYYFYNKGQISHLMYLNILSYLSGNTFRNLPNINDLICNLSKTKDIDRKTYLDRSEADLSEIKLSANIESLFIHQILSASYFKMDFLVSLLGIKFLFIPPGTSIDGKINYKPFYLAETVLTERIWNRIMDKDDGTELAKTDISVSDVQDMLLNANKKVPDNYKIMFPLKADWDFIISLEKYSNKLSHISSLAAKNPTSGTFGLLNLHYSFQFFQSDNTYHLCGNIDSGSNYSIPGCINCSGTKKRSSIYSFRPKLIIGE